MIFQKPTPFTMSIFENVAYGLRLHFKLSRTEIADRVRHALERTALWNEVKDKLSHPGPALSGGQQQRLCIARAIAVEPEVLLMDEPTSAIDPIAMARIEELVRDLKSQYTIVIVTHTAIWRKKGEISADEKIQIQKHTIWGADVLHDAPGVSFMAELVAYHERFDGSGYLKGRKRLAISEFARITALADVYAAMTSPRFNLTRNRSAFSVHCSAFNIRQAAFNALGTSY